MHPTPHRPKGCGHLLYVLGLYSKEPNKTNQEMVAKITRAREFAAAENYQRLARQTLAVCCEVRELELLERLRCEAPIIKGLCNHINKKLTEFDETHTEDDHVKPTEIGYSLSKEVYAELSPLIRLHHGTAPHTVNYGEALANLLGVTIDGELRTLGRRHHQTFQFMATTRPNYTEHVDNQVRLPRDNCKRLLVCGCQLCCMCPNYPL